MDTPELAAFFSESEFPSESELASMPAARVTPEISAADAHSGEEPSGLSGSAAQTGPPAPQGQRGGTAHERSAAPASGEQSPDYEQPPTRDQHVGPATVTEFPIRPQSQPAVALSSLPGPVTLVDLIERSGGLEWREAVAVIQQICLYLKAIRRTRRFCSTRAPFKSATRAKSNCCRGRPAAIRWSFRSAACCASMLMGKEAPPELRLLLSQATFELPIFESIEDVDRALAQMNKLDEPGPAGLALLRAIAAPPKPPSSDADVNAAASIGALDPAGAQCRRPQEATTALRCHLRRARNPCRRSSSWPSLRSRSCCWTRPLVLFPDGDSKPSKPRSALRLQLTSQWKRRPVQRRSGAGSPVSTSPAAPTTRTVPIGAPIDGRAHLRERRGVVVATPLENRIGPIEPPRPLRAGEKLTATLEVMPRIEPAPSKLKETRATGRRPPRSGPRAAMHPWPSMAS